MVFRIGNEAGIDLLLNEFANRFLPRDKGTRGQIDFVQEALPRYANVLKTLKDHEFADRSEALNYVHVLSYVEGDRPVVDAETSLRKFVGSLDDLIILAEENVTASNPSTGEHLNPELFSTYLQIKQRRVRMKTPDWDSFTTRIAEHPLVVAFLEEKATMEKSTVQKEKVETKITETLKPEEKKTVKETPQSQTTDVLMQYILGEKPVKDKNGKEHRISRLEELALLAPGNLQRIDADGKILNPELRREYTKIMYQNRKAEMEKQKSIPPDYRKSLQIRFKDPRAIKYFGIEADYDLCVKQRGKSRTPKSEKKDVSVNVPPHEFYASLERKERIRLSDEQRSEYMRLVTTGKIAIRYEDGIERAVTSEDDLRAFSQTKILEKDPKTGRPRNRIITGIFLKCRVNGEKWNEYVDSFLSEEAAVNHLGGKKTYDDHVALRRGGKRKEKPEPSEVRHSGRRLPNDERYVVNARKLADEMCGLFEEADARREERGGLGSDSVLEEMLRHKPDLKKYLGRSESPKPASLGREEPAIATKTTPLGFGIKKINRDGRLRLLVDLNEHGIELDFVKKIVYRHLSGFLRNEGMSDLISRLRVDAYRGGSVQIDFKTLDARQIMDATSAITGYVRILDMDKVQNPTEQGKIEI